MYNKINRNIIVISVLIMVIGIFSIYSANFNYGSKNMLKDNFYFKQIIWFIASILVLFIVSNLNYRRFYDFSVIIYLAAIIFLVWVLLQGRVILGAKRWLEFGRINFQPSELAKLGVIVVLGRYLSRRKAYGSRFILRGKVALLIRDLIFPFIIVAIPMLLIFLQPDLGTALIFLPIFLSMLFVSEVKLSHLVVFVIVSLCSVPFFWHFLKSYQKERLLVFLNPNLDPLGAGYTIIQSKIAVGSGRLIGKGWLSGTQNQLSFLPERHTDFIFSVLGEEWGFLGSIALIVLFYLLISNLILIIDQTKDQFARLVGAGIISLLTFQMVINISMTIGICPVVGISLPFLSYGGSSLCVFAAFIGILLNINKKRIVF